MHKRRMNPLKTQRLEMLPEFLCNLESVQEFEAGSLGFKSDLWPLPSHHSSLTLIFDIIPS